VKSEFAELCTKSCFSFLRGASHPHELVSRAHQLGYRGLGLLDRHGFYGMVRAQEQAKELKFSIVHGTEISLENADICLIAKNLKGYRSLCRFLSEGFQDQEKGKIHLTRELFEKWIDAQNIFILLAPRNFPSLSLLEWFQTRYPLFQFVTKRLHPDLDLRMKRWLDSLPKNIPRVWTWDPHFHEPSRFELFEVMQGIRENIPLSKRHSSFNSEAYLKPLSALETYQVPLDYRKHSLSILESCEFSPFQIRYHYPREWLPETKTPQSYLRELCEVGLKIRYPAQNGLGSSSAPPSVLAQLEHELALIQELQYEDYFLTVWDIVKYARSVDILCQGRGSAANSVVCYLLEITNIDPVQMNLLFERFISKERGEAPDIDVDFEHERREEVLQYIYKKYGRHRAGMVATLITYRTRSAIRDVGRILEAPSSAIDEFSKRSGWRENVFETPPADPLLARVLRLAKELRGFPRHLGLHTGGIIICQDRLDEISPIENASMANRSTVQWDKYDVEKLGLLKIDILSLGMLTCLRKSFELLKKHQINNLELHSIPHGDKKTYEMIGESRTVGVFQIESRAQMSMLPRLRPQNFYDLVIEVAIVRPGPIQGGMVHPYLRRRMGLEKVDYAHPRLKPILEKTLGIPIFQEQVMKIAIEVAGYSPGEADALRRAMGAWKKSGNLTRFSEDISRRLIERGVPAEFAHRICEQILGFGEYGFPESHAASFALLTYASAYLKMHHPEVFLCGLLNSMPLGFYSLHVLTSAFLREGVKILLFDIAASEWDHTLEKQTDGKFSLRLGFRIVRGLSKKNVESFLTARNQTQKIDLSYFEADERANLALAQANELRREKYWQALAPKSVPLSLSLEKLPRFKIPTPLASMLLDFEFMQTTLQTHPAKLFRDQYWKYPIAKERVNYARDLETMPANRNVIVFGVIQVIQSPPTAKNMVFITLEDETGFLNLVFHPQVFERFKSIIQSEWAILAQGRLQKIQTYSSILVTQIIKGVAPQTAQIPTYTGLKHPRQAVSTRSLRN